MIRAANRDWSRVEVEHLRGLLADQALSIKEIARRFAVKPRSLRTPRSRVILGTMECRRRGSNKFTVPSTGHPVVREAFRIMARQRIQQVDVARRAGLDPSTLSAWKSRKNGRSPSVSDVDAVLNSMGYGLKVVALGEMTK